MKISATGNLQSKEEQRKSKKKKKKKGRKLAGSEEEEAEVDVELKLAALELNDQASQGREDSPETKPGKRTMCWSL